MILTDYIHYVQLVINFYIFILGYSLQCYKGEYMPAKDDKLEETEKEPELLNCTGTDPVCLSTYIRTETIFKKSKREDTTYLAGGWFKECGRKGYQEAKERFGENESDRCVEEKEGTKRVKVYDINA